MGVYINLFETVNGHSRIIKTGKYGIEGCELIFDEANHIGNGLFKVSGKEALKNYQKVMNEISEKTTEHSDKKYLNALVLQLSALDLHENAVYSVDFGEYFSCEENIENKDYDPASIITKRKRSLEDALCGYCEFGNSRQDVDYDFVEMIQGLSKVNSVFCVSHDKDRLIFSVYIDYTEEDKKEFRQTCQFLDDFFVKSHNKRRLFYVLKHSGLDEFSLLDGNNGTEHFNVVVSRDELQKWLVKCQSKSVNDLSAVEKSSSLTDKIMIAEAQKQPSVPNNIVSAKER